MSEDVSRTPTIYRREGVAETEEKKTRALPIQDRLPPGNLLFPAIS
ncbi:MAG: hypothetical protein PVI20_20635 [Desulfobacteraceae bacterium]